MAFLENNLFYVQIKGDIRLLPSAKKLRRLCFNTCLSVHMEGEGLPQCMLGYHPISGADPPGSRPIPLGSRHPPEHTPPGTNTPQKTATAADSTHPTGMHSCWDIFDVALRLYTKACSVFLQIQELINMPCA